MLHRRMDTFQTDQIQLDLMDAQSVNGDLMHIYQGCDGAQTLRFNSHSLEFSTYSYFLLVMNAILYFTLLIRIFDLWSCFICKTFNMLKKSMCDIITM